MLRNVVVGRLKPGVDPKQLEAGLQALRDLRVDGVEFRLVAGHDLGLREGNASFALTADFTSADDYRVYDTDEEHNRIRSELIGPLCASIERIQFELID